ncbi:MAG: glycosyltransferase family protein [Thermodesulfobacteriota bacterium]
MARILLGVMGDAGGHINRARIIAREMSSHEFLFVGGGRAQDLRSTGHAVEDVPCPGTYYRNNRVDILATVRNALRVILTRRSAIKRLADIIRRFDPHLILTDYEYFTPLAARTLGRPCVSIDHQHVLTHCAYEPPTDQLVNRLMTTTVVRKLFSQAERFFITSYFILEPLNPNTTTVIPPIVRRDVTEISPSLADQVLVYQTSPTFHQLFPVLEQMASRFIVYGFGEMPSRKNIMFKAPSRQGFLEDLASCRYVISNGSHNVISESLFLGKPVFSFPIGNAYEQLINAYFLAKLGYGDYSTDANPAPSVLESFEAKLQLFRDNIKGKQFFGNDQLVGLLELMLG